MTNLGCREAGGGTGMTRESIFHGSIFLGAPKTRHIVFKQFYKLKSILMDHLILCDVLEVASWQFLLMVSRPTSNGCSFGQVCVLCFRMGGLPGGPGDDRMNFTIPEGRESNGPRRRNALRPRPTRATVLQRPIDLWRRPKQREILLVTAAP